MEHRRKVKRPATRRHAARAFSLLELSIVLVIVSTIAVMGLEMANQFILRRAYSETQAKLERIDIALMKFYKAHHRLPCVAHSVARNIEDSCDLLAPVVVTGFLPYATLNIPYEDTIDAYGGKITYAVTRGLATDSTTSPATNFNNTVGQIEVRSGRLQNPCTTTCSALADPTATPATGAAYLLLSHGADNRGAYNRQNLSIKACSSNMATETRIDAQNCWRLPAGTPVAIFVALSTARKEALFYDSRYNAGLVANNFFDDIVVWRTKGRIL